METFHLDFSPGEYLFLRARFSRVICHVHRSEHFIFIGSCSSSSYREEWNVVGQNLLRIERRSNFPTRELAASPLEFPRIFIKRITAGSLLPRNCDETFYARLVYAATRPFETSANC